MPPETLAHPGRCTPQKLLLDRRPMTMLGRPVVDLDRAHDRLIIIVRHDPGAARALLHAEASVPVGSPLMLHAPAWRAYLVSARQARTGAHATETPMPTHSCPPYSSSSKPI